MVYISTSAARQLGMSTTEALDQSLWDLFQLEGVLWALPAHTSRESSWSMSTLQGPYDHEVTWGHEGSMLGRVLEVELQWHLVVAAGLGRATLPGICLL